MLCLETLDRSNAKQVLEIQVAKHQQGFVAPIMLSIVESRIYLHLHALVIVTNGLPVGFLLYGRESVDEPFRIARLMIDQKHQRRGHARTALVQLLQRIREEDAEAEVMLSIMPGNREAEALFESLDFWPTGDIDENGELLHRLAPAWAEEQGGLLTAVLC